MGHTWIPSRIHVVIQCVFWYPLCVLVSALLYSCWDYGLTHATVPARHRVPSSCQGCWCILRCFWNRMLTGHGVKWLAPGLKWRSWRQVKVRRLEPITIFVEDWVPKNNQAFSGLSWSIGAMAYFRLVLGIIKQPWIRYLGERHRMVVSWWSQWFFHILSILSILFHPWQFSGTRWFLLIPISLLKHHDSDLPILIPKKSPKIAQLGLKKTPSNHPQVTQGAFQCCALRSHRAALSGLEQGRGTHPRCGDQPQPEGPPWWGDGWRSVGFHWWLGYQQSKVISKVG